MVHIREVSKAYILTSNKADALYASMRRWHHRRIRNSGKGKYMIKERKLEVIVKQRVNHASKKSFTTYATKMKDGKWVDTRFTSAIPKEDLPKAHSFIFVDDDNMNMDKRGQYPKLWIREIKAIEPIERPLEDLDQYFE